MKSINRTLDRSSLAFAVVIALATVGSATDTLPEMEWGAPGRGTGDSEPTIRLTLSGSADPAVQRQLLDWNANSGELMARIGRRLGAARREIEAWSPHHRRPGCEEIVARPFSREELQRLVNAPVYPLGRHLIAADRHLFRAASACVQGTYFATDQALTAAEREFARARSVLTRNGVGRRTTPPAAR